MVIAIESAYGDQLLVGKTLSFDALKFAVHKILQNHSETDFTAVFCAKFGYKVLPCSNGYAAYTVDLDVHKVFVTSYTFPKTLNGAKVLYYTDRGLFEPVYASGGDIAHHVAYLAICKYEQDDDYYVFHCDESLEVVADDCFPSVGLCKKSLAASDIVWYKRSETQYK